jgi:poly-beta-1,6-N-acetyl-D-glucosamine synthase
MMLCFWLISLFFLLLYIILILLICIGWQKAIVFKLPESDSQNYSFISIVVAFRNEYNTIHKLVECLVNQDYPESNYEVIFVDDHSQDNSTHQLQELLNRKTNMRLLSLAEDETGKKAALKLGFQEAKGEIIACTDADCLLGSKWLSTLNSYFIKSGKPDMIIGLVDLLPENSLLSDIFRLEFSSLVISGAGLANMNRAIYCNGANLAIKKDSLADPYILKPLEPSGDDVFLLHDFKKRKKKIDVLFSPTHVVLTTPPKNFKEFINQRIRWASKADAYNDFYAVSTSLIVFGLNLLLLIGFFLLLIEVKVSWIIFILSIKFLADLLVFLCGLKMLPIHKLLKYIVFVEFLYPFYIVFTGLLAIKKPFRWKGRNYSRI